MRWREIEEAWPSLESRATIRWDLIGKAEMSRTCGRREALAELVGERCGLAREAAEREVEEWRRTLHG